jgi:hypothetical protein
MATDVCSTDFLDVANCRRQRAGRQSGTPVYLPLVRIGGGSPREAGQGQAES